VLRHALAVEQGHAALDCAGGEIFGQLAAHRCVGDDAGAREMVFDFAADVGGVPRRPARTQP
jgi:hypothetical protein